MDSSNLSSLPEDSTEQIQDSDTTTGDNLPSAFSSVPARPAIQ